MTKCPNCGSNNFSKISRAKKAFCSMCGFVELTPSESDQNDKPTDLDVKKSKLETKIINLKYKTKSNKYLFSYALFIYLLLMGFVVYVDGELIATTIVGLVVFIIHSPLLFWFIKKEALHATQEAIEIVKNTLNKNNDFLVVKVIFDINLKYGVAIEESKNIFIIFEFDIKNKALLNSKHFDYKDLISSEIVQNGEKSTQTIRTSQIGGTLIGGLLLGAPGAIIGGLSGKQRISSRITELYVTITVNSIENPIYIITFIDRPYLIKSAYEKQIKEASELHGLMSVLIKRADNNFKGI